MPIYVYIFNIIICYITTKHLGENCYIITKNLGENSHHCIYKSGQPRTPQVREIFIYFAFYIYCANMPIVDCPIPGCEYATPDVDPIIVAALITAHATTHATPSTSGPAARVDKVKRPTISLAGTTEDWKYFLSRWDDYVAATRIIGKDRILQLLECCDETLRKDLTRSTVGSLIERSEADVLQAMRTLAVREENIMIARVALNNMCQDRDETIRSFGARLCGQASVCKFVIDCPDCNHEVDYTETILRDVLCRGLQDSDIQLELLGHTNQDMTLEEIFRFIEAKEAGKRSATRLLDTQASVRYPKHIQQK